MAWYNNALDVLDPGDIFGFQQQHRVGTANAALSKAQAKADANSDANRALYAEHNQKVKDTNGDLAGKVGDYLQTFEDQKTFDPGQFNFSGTVNDYYSKFANQRAKQAMNALRESSDQFSSDYQDAMAAKQQALASEEWDKAYERYMQDRQQSANEWQMNTNAGQQAYTNQYSKNKDMLGMAQGAQDNIMNAYGNYINNMANQNNVDTQNYANMVQQQAANNISKRGLLGRIFG